MLEATRTAVRLFNAGCLEQRECAQNTRRGRING